MRKFWIIFLGVFLLIPMFVNAEDKIKWSDVFKDTKLERFNNISIYQHSENSSYKVSIFTSLKKGTWFAQNIFDKFYTTDYEEKDYYTITTFGKYVTKSISVRVQLEKGRNFHTNYYIGMGIDF